MRTIIITGASRGIGYSIAKRALYDGHNISLGIRNPDDLKGSSLDSDKISKNRMLITKYNAKDDNDSEELVKRTVEHFNGFDTLINCAGIFRKTPLLFYVD